MSVKKLDASDVEIGMYVSSLDRPWLGTPFMFQGFTVKHESDLRKLRKYCDHVYIMMPDEEVEMSGGATPPKPEASYSHLLDQERYQITRPSIEALREARESHSTISNLLQDIEVSLSEGKDIDIPVIKNSIEVMVDSIEANPDAYIWLTRIKKFDSYIYKDSLSASVWATTLGRELGLKRDKLDSLAIGAMLMDIGKTALPNELLGKVGRLTDEEWKLMQSHVELGEKILSSNNDVSSDVMDMVKTHHERLDGSGYPAGLSGSSIPLLGQITGIIDFYTALTSTRPYAQAVSSSIAAQMLYQQSHLFSPYLVQKFIYSLSTYPTGSLVELSSGEVGIVVSQNPGLRLKPNVILILNPEKQSYGSYPVVNLADYASGHMGNPVNIRKTLADGDYGISIENLSF